MTGAPSLSEPAAPCLVCRELRGDVAVPGALLESNELVAVFHMPPTPAGTAFLGHLLVTPRPHVSDFAALDASEAAEVGIQIHLYSAALKALGAPRVYIATIGREVDRLHVHLLPSWPETPDEVAWHAVDEWPGARRGDFNEAAAVAEHLRSLVN